MNTKRLCVAVLALLLAPWVALGAVTRLEITDRVPFANGMRFGNVGPYEKVKGRLHYEVDPANSANAQVFDLQFAPLNDNGKVEFAGDFILLKPVDLSRGNHRLLCDVNNRGNLVALGYYNSAPGSNDPSTAADAGNGFLMRQGYSLLWSGWNWDVVPGGRRMQIDLPVATDGGKTISGLINTETVTATLTGPDRCQPVAWGNSWGYEPLDPRDRSEAVLTVRDEPLGARTYISGSLWEFSFQPVQAGIVTNFCLNDGVGIESGRIYELIYRAKDPRITGLGLAAVRDAVSFFHFEPQDSFGTPNPLAVDGTPDPEFAYMFGSSQSGRVIIHMLWQGFHVDEEGRMVAEGLIPHIAGGGKGGFNWRFAQTTHHPSHLEGRYFPVDFFPATYEPLYDPLSGGFAGILDRSRELGKVPLIIQTDHELEYWTRGASLLTTDPLGTSDAPYAENARFYLLNGTQHGTPPSRTRDIYLYSGNVVDQRPIGRALLVVLDNWVSRGIEPPPSRYPRIDQGQLVTPAQNKAMLPAIPDLTVNPGDSEQAWWVDYGQRFFTEGIQTNVPPTIRGEYQNLVPIPDVDGNSLGGLRMPEVQVPLGTNLAWNPRNPAIGNPGFLARWDGSFFMFPLTEDERIATGDPRLSIAERYKDQDDYVFAIAGACERLEREGLLLDEDAQDIVSRAQAMEWPPVPTETFPFWQLRR